MKCIISKPNKTVLVPRNGQTINLFPGVHALTHLDEEFLLVPDDQRTNIVMKHLGTKMPNPILRYYDFGPLKPFHVQEVTLDLMTTTARCYVLNSMGTGKTK